MNRKTIEQVILPQQIPCTRHKIGLGYRIMQKHWVMVTQQIQHSPVFDTDLKK